MLAIEAKELLSLASVLDFPHLNEHGRKDLVRKLQSIIKSNSPSNNTKAKRALTNEEFFAIIGGVTKNEEPRSG